MSEFSIKVEITSQVPVLGLEHGFVPENFSGAGVLLFPRKPNTSVG
jgi:hypothetical protein